MVWGNLILFPMYFLYLITDVAVASFRTSLFLPGVVAQERSGVWSRRFDPKKWIPRFRLMQTCGFVFFWVFSLIMWIFPPAPPNGNTMIVYWPFTSVQILTLPLENLLPIAIIFITFVATSFFGGFAEILTQRVLLDVIPNRIRNSMYSLSPTIATLFAIPQIAIFGWIVAIPGIGFPLTLALCGLISLGGVVLIRNGLHQERPEPEEECWANGNGSAESIEIAEEEIAVEE